MPANTEYNARHLSVLEGLEAVRKRPGMYIGSTDQRGLMHCMWEIIDNAVDEALGGHGDRIEVLLHADGSVEVRDNGRGIPVDIEPRTGLTGVEVVYTKLHAGGKFGGGSYTASGGLHGVGASVVNALSSRLDVEVDRAGKTYAMSFRRGEPGTFSDVAGAKGAKSPDNDFSPYDKGSELEVVGKAKRGVTGTRVRYWADPQIFLKGADIDREALAARARQTSFLVPGLTPREKRVGRIFVASAIVLFACGVYMGSLTFGNAVEMFISATPRGAANFADGGMYFSFVTRFILSFGLTFMLPILLLALNAVGVLKGRIMLKGWRFAVIIAVAFAAIMTPTPDVYTMFLMAVPLIVLFFGSAGLALALDAWRARKEKHERPAWMDVSDDQASAL